MNSCVAQGPQTSNTDTPALWKLHVSNPLCDPPPVSTVRPSPPPPPHTPAPKPELNNLAKYVNEVPLVGIASYEIPRQNVAEEERRGSESPGGKTISSSLWADAALGSWMASARAQTKVVLSGV